MFIDSSLIVKMYREKKLKEMEKHKVKVKCEGKCRKEWPTKDLVAGLCWACDTEEMKKEIEEREPWIRPN